MIGKTPFNAEMLKANPHLHVETRSGVIVDIIEQRLRGAKRPIVGILREFDEYGEDEVETWNADGSYSWNGDKETGLDLFLTL